MSEPEKPALHSTELGGPQAQGPNLKLLYGLIALALAAAIAIAAVIIFPFYQRR
jgi:hypothetical protein